MPNEIERRFLVRPARLPRPLPAGARIVQGYLSVDPVVRVRFTRPLRKGKAQAWLTVKGRGLRTRLEFEYRIPVREARQLLKLCGTRVILKTRWRLGSWILDRFAGRHRGLWIAEIELQRTRAPLPCPRPPWLGSEITGDPGYTNARLAASLWR